MKKFFVIAVAVILTGCVVAPVPRARVEVQSSPIIVYPEPEYEYYWEPNLTLWFRVDPYGRRYYMPHGYVPRGRVPYRR